MRIAIANVKDCGPGDILGAIDGETSVDAGTIGDIQFDGDTVRLEVREDAGKKLCDELDRVAGNDVTVYVLDGDSYYHRMRSLVAQERAAEMERHEQSIRELTGKEREEEGKALLHMNGSDAGKSIEGHKVKFTRAERLPDTQLSVGDLAMVSKNDPLRDDNPTGTVIEHTNYSVTIAFDERPPGFAYGSNVRIDLYVNDITYQRMLDAIEALQDGRCNETVKEVVADAATPRQGKQPPAEWSNRALNEQQRDAVSLALGSDWHLIHGPPGTGKTTTLIEVIQQFIREGKRVLVTASSNTAVDTILEFLLAHNVEAVRVGHPARVTPSLHENTLDQLVQEHDAYQEATELREEAFNVKDERDALQHPSGRYRRGMSDAKIKELARKGRGSRGVSPDVIQEMAEWLELDGKLDDLFGKADELRDEAVQKVLSDHAVVCTTNSTAGSDLLQEERFDVVVIDEATQATEPSCLIPLTHGERVVMAGDHKQLPPTVLAADPLEETLFERLITEEVKTTLRRQYRMHETIMQFSNQQFYDGVLEADAAVRDHTLADLDVHVFDSPVVFIDTDGAMREQQRHGSTSWQNPGEAELVEDICELLRGVDDIGVITPYDDQQDIIDVQKEVHTVDGFQGREKECIIVSFVRSNTSGELGFLTDYRRLNVALTRAKRQLVLIGDAATLTEDSLYHELIEYVKQNGTLISHADLGTRG